MATSKSSYDSLVKEFTEKHLEKIFYYCLKKTGDRYEAEDLAQDISLNVLTSLQNGACPENFSAYVNRIAHNRYCAYAQRKHKLSEEMTGQDIDELDIVDEEKNILEEMIENEQLSALRRELAFISSDYRNVIVAYYFENRSIRDIASSLGVPEGTVKSKLSRARNILKEGMSMAREFGKRSYNPEQIIFTNCCSAFGDNGQPWNVLSHALYKNIFLEAYANPSSAEELSLELGVALPYMEDELQYLTKETFLIKNGNKYETAFPIIGSEAQEEIYEYNLTVIKDITRLLEELIDDFSHACSKHGLDFCGKYQSYEEAKWTLLTHTFDTLMTEVAGEWNYEHTKRPAHGKWDIIGFKKVEHQTARTIGRHGSERKKKPDMETVDFVQFKFSYKNILSKTPPFLSYDESITLKRLAEGNTDGLDTELLDALVKYGYAKKTDDGYAPAIVVFNGNDNSKYFEKFTAEEQAEISEKVSALKKMLCDAAVFAMTVTKKDLPPIFKRDERMCFFACQNNKIDAGHIILQALSDGWIKYSDSMSKAVGAYIYI